jgi:nitroreductase
VELWEAPDARSTVRAFDERPVETGIVVKAIRAALRAPAYNHLWEWGFIEIHDRALRTSLADAAGLEDVSDPSLLEPKLAPLPAEARQIYLRALPLQRTMVLTAPGLLVPVYRPKRGELAPQGPADLNAHAASPASRRRPFHSPLRPVRCLHAEAMVIAVYSIAATGSKTAGQRAEVW